ncbi:Mbov_0399 family ICE element protein [Mycoplasmopsis bovis]|uniref:Mbov_0399 family ICE element protein n=2 Tax=Mycoplasmopsis bovis TaxID=28903 RepID=UPI003D0428C2
MNKKKLKIILSTTFSLPLVALNTSAFFHTNSSNTNTRYFDFPISKYPTTVEYDRSTFSFENVFSDPSSTGPAHTREFFRMRIWEPKKWSEVLNKDNSSKIGKWQIIDEEKHYEDIYDFRDERQVNGAINTKVVTKVKGFKITREFNSLDQLINSIWWEKDDKYGFQRDFIETFNYYKNKERNSSSAAISKITMSLEAKNLNARKVDYLTNNFNPDDDDEEESNDDIKYTNENQEAWDRVTNYKITVELSRPRNIEHIFTKYKTDFNNIKSRLEAYNFNFESDTGGQLGTDEYKENGDKTNIQKLDEKLQEFNRQNTNNSKLRAEFEVTSPSTIDIYLKNENGSFKELVAHNVKVNITPSATYNGRIATKDLEQRLIIKLGKWVDFQNGTTKLVDDKLVKYPSDKSEIKTGPDRYGGKWIAHTPLKVNFTATSDETEVITINGKKIDVINYRFEEDLTDNRKDANDKDRVFNADIKEQNDKTAKDESNSHAKNEYKIEITKYKDKAHKKVEYKYTKIIVIDSRSSQMDYKWFAWDPEKNKHQKELIEEFLTDEKGEVKKDKDGKPIPNPKYDPLIDKKTGTKKQLVWFDFKNGNTQPDSGLFAHDDINKYPEKDGWYYTNSDFAEDISGSDKNYYKITKAPYKTKTLFAPHSNENDLDPGVIAEAVVLDGKGALKQLIGKNENATLFKLTSRGLYKIPKNAKKRFLELANETGSDNYFSEEGIWLFTSNAKDSISNYKFVLINKDSSPYSQFLDNLPNFDSLKPLWETKQGKRFFEYLEATKKLKYEQIKLLNYEDVMEYYKQYINDLWNGFEVNSPIAITPKFKKIPKQKNISDIATVDKFKQYLDEFENSDKVELSKVEVGGDNYLKVFFKFKTTNTRYRLSQDEYAVPVEIDNSANGNSNSGDSNDPSNKKETKENIYLNLNSQLFLNLAAKNSYSSFKKYLPSIPKKDVFLSLDEKHLKLLNINYELNERLKLLIVNVSFIDSNNNEKYNLLPKNSFTILLDFAKSISDDGSNNRKPSNSSNGSDWEKVSPKDDDSNNRDGNSNNGSNSGVDNNSSGSNRNNGSANGNSTNGNRNGNNGSSSGDGNSNNGSNSGIDPNKNPYADPFSEKWPNDNSSGNNGINDDESDISEDKRSIFNGIVFKRINLKGTSTFEEAKEWIKKLIQKQTPNLKLGSDYEIKNLDQIARERIYPQTNVSDFKNVNISIANLQALGKKFGYARVEVVNVVAQALDEDIDLSKIKLNDINLNESKLSSLKTKVIDEINKQFKDKNLELGKDLLIKNYEATIRALALGKGISANAEIIGNNIRIKNSAFVKITNSATKVINDELSSNNGFIDPNNNSNNGNRNAPNGESSNDNSSSNNANDKNENESTSTIYDLSFLKLEKLEFTEHIMSELRNKIVNAIIMQLNEKYFLEYKKHYDIDLNELNAVVKKLATKSNESIESVLTIRSIPKVSRRSALATISNLNKLLDPIEDLDKPLNINNNSNSRKLTQKQILLIFIPLGLLGATGIGTLIGFIYIRKVKNKIK